MKQSFYKENLKKGQHTRKRVLYLFLKHINKITKYQDLRHTPSTYDVCCRKLLLVLDKDWGVGLSEAADYPQVNKGYKVSVFKNAIKTGWHEITGAFKQSNNARVIEVKYSIHCNWNLKTCNLRNIDTNVIL